MALYNIPHGLISTAQEELLGQGQRAAGTTAVKTYASLANNQTLTLLENVAGVPTLITFEVKKSASGWTPTGGAVVVIDITAATDSATAWAAIVAFLDARPNAAYTFTASASGYTFVAKQTGDKWNTSMTGTALVSSSSLTTLGANPVAEQGEKIDSLSAGGFVDAFANAVSYYCGAGLRVSGLEPANLVGVVCDAVLKIPFSVANAFPGGGLGLDQTVWYRYTNTILFAPGTGKWGFGFYGRLGSPASGKLAKFCLADYRHPTQKQRIEIGHDYSLGGAGQTRWYTKMVTSSDTTGGEQYVSVATGDGFYAWWVICDGTVVRIFLDGVQVGENTDMGHIPSGIDCLSAMCYASGLNAGYGICRIAWAQ